MYLLFIIILSFYKGMLDLLLHVALQCWGGGMEGILFYIIFRVVVFLVAFGCWKKNVVLVDGHGSCTCTFGFETLG